MNIIAGNIVAESAPRTKKLAEGVAAAIVRDVMAMGWPVGGSVGSMQDLLSRHGVSHAVLREAVRQIEQNGLAVMRRGAGGGLVVAKRPGDVAAQALATYAQLVDIYVRELIAARFLFEDAMVRAVSLRMTAADATRLRVLGADLADGQLPEIELIVRYNRLSTLLSEIADNPLLTVMNKLAFRALTPALARADPARLAQTIEPGSGPAFVRRWKGIIEALISDDPAAAIEILHAARPGIEESTVQRAAERRRQAQAGAATLIATEILEAVDESRGRKHSQLVALSIARNIAANGWPEGHHLGLEPALLAAYQVSRNIFREAARILEVHGVCAAKRGQRGGFIVGRPRPDYAVETAVASLRFLGLEPYHVGEARLAIQPSLAALCAASDGRAVATLAAAVAGGDAAGAARRFLEALGPASENRALALVNAVLLGVEDPGLPLKSTSETGAEVVGAALAAIRAHDQPLARRIVLDLCRMDHPDV